MLCGIVGLMRHREWKEVGVHTHFGVRLICWRQKINAENQWDLIANKHSRTEQMQYKRLRNSHTRKIPQAINRTSSDIFQLYFFTCWLCPRPFYFVTCHSWTGMLFLAILIFLPSTPLFHHVKFHRASQGRSRAGGRLWQWPSIQSSPSENRGRTITWQTARCWRCWTNCKHKNPVNFHLSNAPKWIYSDSCSCFSVHISLLRKKLLY